jgi:uncharacterized protein (TIGR02246 family)
MFNDLIIDFFDCMNTRDLERFGELLAEDAEFYFPKAQPMQSKERILRFFNILFKKFPELNFKIQRTIVQGSQAAVHWANQGINKDQEPYDNEGVTLLKMEGDQIKFISDFFKSTEKF